MPRTNMDGKGIKRVLQWMLDRDLNDADLAHALGMSDSSYSRNKDDDNFPSFEQLETLGQHFDISPTVLHIAFGLVRPSTIELLTEDEKHQYLEMGGANHPTLMVTRKEGLKTRNGNARPRSRTAVIRDEIDRRANAPWLAKPSV